MYMMVIRNNPIASKSSSTFIYLASFFIRYKSFAIAAMYRPIDNPRNIKQAMNEAGISNIGWSCNVVVVSLLATVVETVLSVDIVIVLVGFKEDELLILDIDVFKVDNVLVVCLLVSSVWVVVSISTVVVSVLAVETLSVVFWYLVLLGDGFNVVIGSVAVVVGSVSVVVSSVVVVLGSFVVVVGFGVVVILVVEVVIVVVDVVVSIVVVVGFGVVVVGSVVVVVVSVVVVSDSVVAIGSVVGFGVVVEFVDIEYVSFPPQYIRLHFGVSGKWYTKNVSQFTILTWTDSTQVSFLELWKQIMPFDSPHFDEGCSP